MQEQIVETFWRLIPVLVGVGTAAWIAHKLTISREQTELQNDFAVAVRKIIFRFSRENDLVAVHKDTMVELAVAYYRVRRFNKRSRFKADKEWHEYANMKEDEFTPHFKAAEMSETEVLKDMFEALKITRDPARKRVIARLWSLLKHAGVEA